MSSVYNVWNVAGCGNDGNTASPGAVTRRSTNPWWQVDLVENYIVHGVKFYNRPSKSIKNKHVVSS